MADSALSNLYGISFMIALSIVLTHVIWNTVLPDVYWQVATMYCVIMLVVFIIGGMTLYHQKYGPE